MDRVVDKSQIFAKLEQKKFHLWENYGRTHHQNVYCFHLFFSFTCPKNFVILFAWISYEWDEVCMYAKLFTFDLIHENQMTDINYLLHCVKLKENPTRCDYRHSLSGVQRIAKQNTVIELNSTELHDVYTYTIGGNPHTHKQTEEDRQIQEQQHIIIPSTNNDR